MRTYNRSMSRGDIRIGISGWRYEPWRGTFYPKGLAQRRELEYASRRLSTIEINGSFYSLQTPDSYRMWREATPDRWLCSHLVARGRRSRLASQRAVRARSSPRRSSLPPP